MEIIKEGKTPDTRREFRCRYCGCMFRAEKGEWKTQPGEYQTIDYVCGCPCCGEHVYGGKEVS